MIAETIGGVCRLMTGRPERPDGGRLDVEPRVYFANHASHLDFVLIWSALPARCRIRFGAPVPGASGEDKQTFLARARDALVSMGGCDAGRH